MKNLGRMVIILGGLGYFFGIFSQVQGLTLALFGIIIAAYMDLEEKIYRLQDCTQEAKQE